MPERKNGRERPSPEALDRAKRASTIQLLFRCGRVLNEEAIERLRKSTGQPVRTAHTALLPHIDLEGTRLTDLAERAGVTKQAVLPLVDEMIAMGMLERIPDPQDGRARKIRFSPAGRRGLLEGLGVLRELEGELSNALGERRLRRLHETLLDLSDFLDARAGTPRKSHTETVKRRRTR
jgi:DNA-binding MarR family transcriptional regulator